MTHFCWWFVDILSRMLETDERDAVRGDLAESGATGGQALRDVMGFVVRRQAALWKDWHPWLALAGLVGVAGVLLSEIAFQFDLAIVHIGTELSVGRDTVYLVCLFLALFSWSWAGGFLLGSFSGVATWLTGTLFCLVIHSWPQMVLLRLGRRASLGTQLWEVVLNLLFMMSIPTLPFLLAAIWGNESRSSKLHYSIPSSDPTSRCRCNPNFSGNLDQRIGQVSASCLERRSLASNALARKIASARDG
jgi:hypothetical protein